MDWLQLSGLGIGGAALVMIFMGRLIPSWWVDKQLAAKDQIIGRQQTALDKNSQTLDQLVMSRDSEKEAHAAILHALESIQDAAAKARADE